MRILFLLIWALFPGEFSSDVRHSLPSEYDEEQNAQMNSSPIATSCREVLDKAIALNESFNNAVSEGGRRALGLELEKFVHTVLREKLSGCIDYASSDSDTALSGRIFELAYSFSDSSDDFISLELARFYSLNPERTKAILFEYQKTKRHELIETLQRGLAGLYAGRNGKALQLKKLNQLLNKIGSD